MIAGIDGGEKRSHRVVCRHKQKVSRSVWPRDVTVKADA
jgi:hypothetical protein